MPFTCAICNIEIQVGEPMLSDEKMNLAHERCIVKETQIPKTVHIPSVTIGGSSIKFPPPPPVPPSPLDNQYRHFASEPCLMPTKTVPGCPRCGTPLGPVLKGSYAHYPDSYFCDRCARFIETPLQLAAPATTVSWKPSYGPVSSVTEIAPQKKNGKHVAPKLKKGKGRR